MPTTPPGTLPGTVLGTIGYMAPEQVRGQQADHRSDIFAFGAILYEMLAGQRAFQGETSAETMTAILKEDPAELPVVARHIPSVLERIVNRCLEKNPAARFKSTDDLAFALEALSTHSGEAAALSATPARSHRDPLAWSVAGVLAVLLLVALPTTLYLRPSAPGGRQRPLESSAGFRWRARGGKPSDPRKPS